MNRVIDDYFNQECNIDTSVKIGDYKRSFNLDSMNTPTTIPINRIKTESEEAKSETEEAADDKKAD